MSRGHRASPGEASCTYLSVQFPGDIGQVKERLAVHLSIPEQCPGDIGLVQERLTFKARTAIQRPAWASDRDSMLGLLPT